jgi:hypothetical protein
MLLYQQFFYLLIGLGVLLGLPALWMFARAMWPATVERGRQVASGSLLLNFLCGLPVVGLAVFLTTHTGRLGKFQQAGGVISLVLVGLIIMWGLVGVAGLAAHVGARLWPECTGADAWRGMLRGCFVVSGVLAIPFIGWFILLLVLITVGYGMRVRMWFVRPPANSPAPVATQSATTQPAA